MRYRPTPAQAGLVLLCLVWLLAGLIGHAPWKGGDGAHFAAFLNGGWIPPLYYWTAQLSAWLTSAWLPVHDGARLASGVFVALALGFIARAAASLYGEDHAWAAALTLLGCAGLLVRGHEMNLYTAQLAAAAITLYGMARLPDGWRGAAGLAAGLVLMLLAGGAAEPALFAFMALCLPILLPQYRTPRAGMALVTGLLAAGLLTGLGLAVIPPGDLGAALAFSRWQGTSAEPLYFPSIYGWYAWPAWPLALWALWRARRHWRTAGILLPVLAAIGLFALYARLARPSEAQALILLAPVALIGAAGLVQLRRGAANALLWFSVTSMALVATFIWVYWSALDLGVPARLAARLLRLGVNETGDFRLLPWLIGVVLTALWIGLLLRIQRSPLRPILVWTGSVTFVWSLLFTLFLQPLDNRLSYRSVAAGIAARVPAGACIDASDTAPQARRLLAYHSQRAYTVAPGCRWKLAQAALPAAESTQAALPAAQSTQAAPPAAQPTPAALPAAESEWRLRWSGQREGERHERFFLYGRP